MTDHTTYTADLEQVRRLLINASHWPELSHALRTVAEAEVVERRLSHRHDAPLCALVREAIMARHRDRATATAALPELREAARKAAENVTMYEGQRGASAAHLYHLNGVSLGFSWSVQIVERAAQAPTGPTAAATDGGHGPNEDVIIMVGGLVYRLAEGESLLIDGDGTARVLPAAPKETA